MKKPRCPTCDEICVAIYRRRGKSANWERIRNWACCNHHGPTPS